MKIFIKTPQGENIVVQIESYQTGKKLTQIVRQQLNFKQNNIFSLIYQGKNISKEYLDQTLQYLGMQQNCTIFIILRLAGGYCMPCFNFNNLNHQKIKKFGQKCSKNNNSQWRRISRGLNLQGKCINQKCRAYDKKVWINKYFGKFNINKQVVLSKCPICQQVVDYVTNMGLYLAQCKIKGVKIGQRQQITLTKRHQKNGDFLTFQNKDQNIVKWNYLQMEVTEL